MKQVSVNFKNSNHSKYLSQTQFIETRNKLQEKNSKKKKKKKNHKHIEAKQYNQQEEDIKNISESEKESMIIKNL